MCNKYIYIFIYLFIYIYIYIRYIYIYIRSINIYIRYIYMYDIYIYLIIVYIYKYIRYIYIYMRYIYLYICVCIYIYICQPRPTVRGARARSSKVSLQPFGGQHPGPPAPFLVSCIPVLRCLLQLAGRPAPYFGHLSAGRFQRGCLLGSESNVRQ